MYVAGDEGGFAPNIASNDEGLDLVNQAIAVSLPPHDHLCEISVLAENARLEDLYWE